MRTQTERMTHGICAWGVILIGVLVMLSPGAATAEMPRAVYYDTKVAKVIGDPVPQRAPESAHAGDATPSTGWSWGDVPDTCMDAQPPVQMPAGFATRFDLIRR